MNLMRQYVVRKIIKELGSIVVTSENTFILDSMPNLGTPNMYAQAFVEPIGTMVKRVTSLHHQTPVLLRREDLLC